MTSLFHVGTHKTGTTSIQRFLSSNRVELKKHGILYPDYPDLIPVKDSHYAHLDLAKSMAQAKNRRFSHAQVREMFESINKLQKDNVVLISSEPFWRIGFGKTNKPFSQKEALLARFFNLVDSPRFLLTIRARPDFMLSMYSENILQTVNTYSFDEFIDSQWYLFDYQGNIDLWSKFGSVSVVSFEHLTSNSNIGYNFLKLATDVKIQAVSEKPSKIFNQSLSLPLLVYKLTLNRRGVEGKNGKNKIAKLQTAINDGRLSNISEHFKNYSWKDGDWWVDQFNTNDHFSLLQSYSPGGVVFKELFADIHALAERRSGLFTLDKATEDLIVNYLDEFLADQSSPSDPDSRNHAIVKQHFSKHKNKDVVGPDPFVGSLNVTSPQSDCTPSGNFRDFFEVLAKTTQGTNSLIDKLNEENFKNLSLSAQKADLESELARAKERCDDLCTTNSRLQSEVSDLRQQLDENSDALESRYLELEAKDSKLLLFREEIASLRDTLDSYKISLRRAQKSRGDHAKARYRLAQQINDLKDQLLMKIQDLECSRNEIAVMTEGYKTVETEMLDSREEARLTLQQLNLVQDELEQYYNDSVLQLDLLRQYQIQGLEMRKIISRLFSEKRH